MELPVVKTSFPSLLWTMSTRGPLASSPVFHFHLLSSHHTRCPRAPPSTLLLICYIQKLPISLREGPQSASSGSGPDCCGSLQANASMVPLSLGWICFFVVSASLYRAAQDAKHSSQSSLGTSCRQLPKWQRWAEQPLGHWVSTVLRLQRAETPVSDRSVRAQSEFAAPWLSIIFSKGCEEDIIELAALIRGHTRDFSIAGTQL